MADRASNLAVTLRAAAPEDIGAVRAIYGEAVETLLATWDEMAPTPAAVRDKFERLTGEGYPYLVAETEDGEIAGFAYAGPFHPHSG